MNTTVSDETLYRVLSANSLSKLETFSVQKAGRGFTMAAVESLMSNCPRLKMIKDLTYCAGIHENEVKILRCRIRDENIDLRLEDRMSESLWTPRTRVSSAKLCK